MFVTIGIPTRNRADFIFEALSVITNEIKSCPIEELEQIEVVIVDGASEDNTKEVVDSFKSSINNLVYFRRDECVGVDKDLSKCVEIAKGKFCWLLSDDDHIIEGSLSNVISMLREKDDITGATLNYSDYDNKLKFPITTNPSSSGNILKGNYLFNDAENCFNTIGLQISFISTQVVNTKYWKEIIKEYDLEPFINDWLMVYIMGKMILKRPKWYYYDKICVKRRVDNDSFSEKVGVYNRQLITHVAYKDTICGIFGSKSPVVKNVFYNLLNDRMMRSLAVIKANKASFTLQIKLLKLYTKNYGQYLTFWLSVFPVFFIPNFFLNFLRKIYLINREAVSE